MLLLIHRNNKKVFTEQAASYITGLTPQPYMTFETTQGYIIEIWKDSSKWWEFRCVLESTALDLYNYTELGCKVWRLDCTLWFYKSSGDMYRGGQIGKIIKPKLTMLLDLDKVV